MSAPSPEPQPRGRPRRAETDVRIVRAAMDLLREGGPADVNVASVATRSGVARTTIYRRYADREALLRSALATVTERGMPTGDLPLREKLLWVLERTEEVLAQGIGIGGVAAVLADSDPEFSSALRRSLADGLAPIRAQISADAESGVIAGTTDADTVVGMILGSYLAEIVLHGSVRTDWQTRTVELLVAALSRAR